MPSIDLRRCHSGTVKFKRPAQSPFRKYWALDRGLVFLNHGSFGACPKPVLAIQSALRKEMEASPVRFLWRFYEDRLQPARAALAKFLNANHRDLVFVTNSTAAVNAVARSWKLRRGDEILTTNLDYNACRNVLAEVAKAAGAKLVVATIPLPIRQEDDLVGAILSRVTSRTRYAMIDHVTSGSALVLPVARIVRELEARGIDTLVDGAHAPGMLSLNLRNLRPAWYCGNLHKWVCAPKGSAFLWARGDRQDSLQPAVISHGNNCPRRGFSSFQDRFDWAGTFDPSAWFCVPDAIQWMGGLLPDGWSGLRRRNHELALDARDLLCGALEVEAPCPAGMIGSMATIPLPGRFQGVRFVSKIAPEQVCLYDKYGIEVPFVKIDGLRCFRVSAQIYNTSAEYAFLADCVHRLGAGPCSGSA